MVRTVGKGKTKVLIETDIESLEIKRFNRFGKHMMVQLEVGNDFGDFMKRIGGAIEAHRHGMMKEAQTELHNFKQMVWNMFTEYEPRGYALAMLIEQIGSTKYGRNRTPEVLDEILEKLDEVGMTHGELVEAVNEAKKKIEQAIDRYFPNKRASYQQKVYGSSIINRMEREIEMFINGIDLEEEDEQIKSIDERLYRLNRS